MTLLSVCLCIPPPPIVARQMLGKHASAATNTHAAIGLLDAMFSIRSVSYQYSYVVKEK
jgi:hypothetical protein